MEDEFCGARDGCWDHKTIPAYLLLHVSIELSLPHPLPVTQTIFFSAMELVLTTFVRSTGICHRGLKENLAEGKVVEAWSTPSVPSVEHLSVTPV